MGVFGKRAPSHLIPVSPDNAASNDWVVLLEAGTIVGPSPDRLRVAKSTLEKKIVKRYNFFLRATHFLDVEGYDPRIHAVYFCPQLYKYDPDKTAHFDLMSATHALTTGFKGQRLPVGVADDEAGVCSMVDHKFHTYRSRDPVARQVGGLQQL